MISPFRYALLLCLFGLSSCATSRQIELEFQVRQLELALSYAHEDNAALMRVVDEYERGLRIQAEIIYKLDRNCSW